jgi:hypothetical protein
MHWGGIYIQWWYRTNLKAEFLWFIFFAKNSDILKKALQQLKNLMHEEWNLCYMLTDDSAAKQAAVKKAF